MGRPGLLVGLLLATLTAVRAGAAVQPTLDLGEAPEEDPSPSEPGLEPAPEPEPGPDLEPEPGPFEPETPIPEPPPEPEEEEAPPTEPA